MTIVQYRRTTFLRRKSSSNEFHRERKIRRFNVGKRSALCKGDNIEAHFSIFMRCSGQLERRIALDLRVRLTKPFTNNDRSCRASVPFNVRRVYARSLRERRRSFTTVVRSVGSTLAERMERCLMIPVIGRPTSFLFSPMSLINIFFLPLCFSSCSKDRCMCDTLTRFSR